MCEGYVEKPLYLLIAEWMMAENRWVIAREISIHFDIEHSKAVNTLTYILSEVTEISCEVKMIPNKLEGRGCQCQRLVKVVDIDEQIYARLRNNSREKLVGVRKTPRIPAVPLTELIRPTVALQQSGIRRLRRIRQDHRLGVTSVVPCKRGRFSSICLSGCVSCNDA